MDRHRCTNMKKVNKIFVAMLEFGLLVVSQWEVN